MNLREIKRRIQSQKDFSILGPTPAFLGDHGGIVADPENKNHVFVRLFNGQVLSVFNDRVKKIPNLPVLIGHENGHLRVIGPRDVYDTPTYTGVLEHSEQHAPFAEDALNIWAEQMMPWMVLPVPGQMKVRVLRRAIWNGSQWLLPSEGVVDLVSYVPSDGARFVLLSIVNGNVQVTPGTVKDNIGLLEEGDIPAPGEGIPIAAVRLYSGQLEIAHNRDATDIVDLRDWGIKREAKTFLDLSDTPGTYSGQAQRVVRVKSTEDGLEFADAGAGDMMKAVYDTDNDGMVDAAESVPWSGVTGKPSTFPPDEHGHTFIGLTDTPSSYSGSSGKAVKVKSTEDGLEFGTVGDMLKSTYDTNDDGIVDAAETVPWGGVTGKPSTFPPDEHDHSLSGDVGGSLSNTVVSALRGKPIVDPLSPSKEDIIKWDGTKYISDKESFYKMVVFSASEGLQLLGTYEFNEDNLRYHLEADWPFLIYLPPGSVTFSSPVTLGNARKTLIGKGPNLTSLVGQINGGNLVMSGITVYAEASGTVNSVLNFGSGSVDLDDCRIILDNANYPGYAIRLHGNSYLGKISNCVISVLYDDESSTAFGVFDSAVGSEVYFSVIDAVPVYPSSSDKVKFYGCLFPKYSPENIPQTMLAAGDRARITSERFIGLVDAPSSYSGQAQKIVRVKSSEDGLEFAEGGGGAQTFLQLTDTPSSYSGHGKKIVRVNSDATGLEFLGYSKYHMGWARGENGTSSTTGQEMFRYTFGEYAFANREGLAIGLMIGLNASVSSSMSCRIYLAQGGLLVPMGIWMSWTPSASGYYYLRADYLLSFTPQWVDYDVRLFRGSSIADATTGREAINGSGQLQTSAPIDVVVYLRLVSSSNRADLLGYWHDYYPSVQ